MRTGLTILLVVEAAAGAQRYLPPPEAPPVRLFPAHPRLSFRPAADRGFGRSFEEVRELYRRDAAFRGIFGPALAAAADGMRDPAAAAAAWVVSGEGRFAKAAAAALLAQPISQSRDGQYSNLWAFALAWDWLYRQPELDGGIREKAAALIAERLETELAWLDGGYMATWHGRNQAANGAMVAALALGDLPAQERNLARAAAHYAEALRALDFSEGWPEGPSYWIHNRAAPYALAADCYLTATGKDEIAGLRIRGVMRKAGLWSIYQFAPNGVFEPYGDSAGSLRLGETGWWEATVDYFARLSRDPSVAAGADWFRNRSPAPYGKRPLHWWAALAYDPSSRPARGYDATAPQLWLRKHLPQAMLFGRQSIGVAFFRGAWGDADEIFASFKAGDLLAHHDHYDAGHFSIQRGGLLAPLTGIYGDPGGYTGAYRLGYAIQTVASNSLLILAPRETSANLRAQKPPSWTALSGGQRVIRPTGFDCLSVEHFRAQLDAGPHLERAAITAFESVPGQFDYIAADITAAYNSTRWTEPGSDAKVALVTRQFLYLRREEVFVIHDRVETTRPSYLPKFLLHALAKPITASERLLDGAGPENGILESLDRRLTVAHNRGVLTAVSLLPLRARALKVGGRDYYAYVERDGDQANGFNGVNLSGGDPAVPGETKQLGLWRVEIEPTSAATSHRFLTVLAPRLVGEGPALPEIELVDAGPAANVARVGRTMAVFAHSAGPLDEVTVGGAVPARVIILDARAGRAYRAGTRTAKASPEGVLKVDLTGGSRSVRVQR